MNMQLDPELLLAKYKQNDFERVARRARQVREAKATQSSWFNRRDKTVKETAKWESK